MAEPSSSAPISPLDEVVDAPGEVLPFLDATALPPLDELLEELAAQLAAWMPRQRWYAHKGATTPTVAVRGWAPLRVAPDHAVLLTVVVVGPTTPADTAAGVDASDGATGADPDADGAPGAAAVTALYQVPLVLRPAASAPAEEGAEIAVLAVPGGPLRFDDALRDVDGRAALVATLLSGDGALGDSLALTVRRPDPDAPLPFGRAMTSRLLAGEQSNTSMIVETEGAPPLILKLFRLLQHGENPDIVLQEALARAGSTRVPALRGSARLRCGDLVADALLAQEFLPGVEDAWRAALRWAAAGEDITDAIGALGATVAEVHADLARTLGTAPADPSAPADPALTVELVRTLRERLRTVAAELPQVAEHAAAIGALLDSAAEQPWPALQRIHGDLHLGQVLLVPERGWVLLDFEGEPLRPLVERSRPDSPLRDVAGMLRSLDYAAGTVARDARAEGADGEGAYAESAPGESAQAASAEAWALRAREAFLAGYSQQSGTDLSAPSFRVLLAALEADKAVYEALYEARNRPDWLPIPLSALARISAAAAAEGSAG
ncbi:maltokinase N-terminal cap-like domain-containing protein [Brachybacterium sp. J153]|uniref:maltokinase N-terminal cap-like domain-containing protein n=1 Tax=Brachybacterium sp. J153 TaxID=3116488 RepID=UPI002E7A2F07|nr:trehalose biosynthesis protein [Brachybacterium sp. J153]MEE1617982.1 trehalose biosynthesis protein [Brachybacterium sp. J153]